MDNPGRTKTVETPLSRDLVNALRYYMSGRRGLLILATVLIAAGLSFNWSWLVAAGVAPILIGALPCVAMCALGLCMNKLGGRSCSSDPSSAERDAGTIEDEATPGTPADIAEIRSDRSGGGSKSAITVDVADPEPPKPVNERIE